jgi:hypothetical protein
MAIVQGGNALNMYGTGGNDDDEKKRFDFVQFEM